MSDRGICPDCHGVYTVKRDGTLRQHVSDVLPPGSIFRSVCPGTGNAPVGADSLIAGMGDDDV